MDEQEYDNLKKDWDEQTALLGAKDAHYEKEMNAMEAQLDLYEIDCAVFKSKRCLEAFDQIQVMRRRFARARMERYLDCIIRCHLDKPHKWTSLDLWDMPMRNEEEERLYMAFRSCWLGCARHRMRTLRVQLDELTRAKEQVEKDFLQTKKDPLRINDTGVSSYARLHSDQSGRSPALFRSSW